VRKHSGEVRSRREFVAGVLRYTALGLMGVASAALFAKRQRLVRNGQCTNSGICAGCKVLEECSLPQAVSAKKTPAGIDYGKR
jgi:hypothetical protein